VPIFAFREIFIRRQLAPFFKPETVDPDCPTCGAPEDFSRILRAKLGCFIFIGNGADGDGQVCPSLHNPHYDLNDDILANGRDFWVALVEGQLGVAED